MVKFIENKASGVIQKLTGPLPIQTAGLAPSGSYDVWNGSENPAAATLVISGAVNVVAPSATGELLLGSNASGSNGTWAGGASYNYKWTRDDVDIPGATTQNYAFQPADQGLRIEFSVQAVDVFGTLSPWVKSPDYFDFPAAGGYYLADTDFTVSEQSGANTRKATVTITKDLPSDLRQYQVYTGTNIAGVLSAATISPTTGDRPGPFVWTGTTQWSPGTALYVRVAFTDAGDDTNPVWVSAAKPLIISGLPPALTGVEILTGTVTAGDITIKIPSVTEDPVRANTSYEYRISGGTPVTLTGGTTINVLRTIGGLGAVAVTVEVRAVNLNGNGPWIAPVSVTPFAALATTSLTSVTINSTTYAISASSTPGTPVPAGYDLDGNAFVVGTFWLISSSVPPDLDGTRAIHGIVKNPDHTSSQGWDTIHGGTYAPGLLATLPLEVTPDDVVVQVISRTGLGSTQANTSLQRQGVITKVNALYSLAAAPTATALTPAVIWNPANKATRPKGFVDADAILASLPAPRDLTGIRHPNWATVGQNLDRFDPMAGKYFEGNAATGYERSLTYRIGGNDGNYGEKFALIINAMLLGIRGNTWSDADKKAAIKRLCSFGHQWYWGMKARNARLDPDGGHFQYYWAPMIAYLTWSGQTSEFAFFQSNLLGHLEMAQRMNAEYFGHYRTPHISTTRMSVSRIRILGTITSQTSFTLRFDSNNGDTSKIQLRDNLLIRVATGEARVITGSGQDIQGVFFNPMNIASEYSTPITLADTFYMQAPYEIKHGDIFWNNGAIEDYYASPNNAYISNQRGWTGQLQFLASTGLLPDFCIDAARLTVRHNKTNEPVGFDFASFIGSYASLAGVFTYPDGDQYATYGAADFAPYVAPKVSIPSIYGQTVSAISGTQAYATVGTTDSEGGFFWVAVPSGEDAPTAQQILERKKSNGTTAPVFGEKNVLGTGTTNWTLEGFTSSTTYDLYFVQQDWSGNFSNILKASITTTTGTTYRETFAGRQAGDLWATDPPGDTLPFASLYSRGGTNVIPVLVADAGAPNGLSLDMSTSITYKTMRLDALTARLALPWTHFQARGLVRIRTSETNRYGYGHALTGSSHNGIRIVAGSFQLQLRGNMDTGTNITVAPTASFVTDEVVEMLFEVGNPDKKTMRMKCWKVGPTGGLPEPAWGATPTSKSSEVTVTDITDIEFNTFGFAMVRTEPRWHGLIVTVDGDAPTF